MEISLKATTPNEKIIKEYLEKNANESLALKINTSTKTLKGCWNYVIEEARKRAVDNCAVIQDQEVFGWAIHYFEEDTIKEAEKPKNDVKVVAPKQKEKIEGRQVDGQVTLFDFDGGDDDIGTSQDQ